MIDTDHSYYISRFINNQDQSVKKELAFNYTFHLLCQKYIMPYLNISVMNIHIDNRSQKTGQKYNLQEYINTSLLAKHQHKCEQVVIYWVDSKLHYGVQLADLISNIVFTNLEYGAYKALYTTYIKPQIKGVVWYPRKNT